MSLARNKDSELLQAFEGCFEGDEYKGEIDDDLFLAQVSAVGPTQPPFWCRGRRVLGTL